MSKSCKNKLGDLTKFSTRKNQKNSLWRLRYESGALEIISLSAISKPCLGQRFCSRYWPALVQKYGQQWIWLIQQWPLFNEGKLLTKEPCYCSNLYKILFPSRFTEYHLWKRFCLNGCLYDHWNTIDCTNSRVKSIFWRSWRSLSETSK